MFPLFEGGEEGQELAFVDGVVVFRGVELFGETANELVMSLLVALVECGTEGVVARINAEVVGEGWVREAHGDFVAHGLLQAVAGGKLAVTPRPGDGGLQQLRPGGPLPKGFPRPGAKRDDVGVCNDTGSSP